MPTRRRSLGPLLLVALLTLAALAPLVVPRARRATVDPSIDVLLAADARSRGSIEKLETMMTQRVAVVVLARFEGIFSDAGAALIDELGRTLLGLEGVPRVYSLTRAERPVRAPGLSLSLESLIRFEPFLPLDGRSDEQWRAIEADVTSYPWARDLLVSRDGRWCMLVAEVARDRSTPEAKQRLRSEVSAAMEPFRARTDELHLGSFPFVEAEIRDDIAADVRRFLSVLPVLLATILLVAFRSVWVLACVLVFEAMGVGLLPVLFEWNGATINIHTGILLPLVAGLQLTFLTHFFAALRWAQHKGLELGEALRVALRHVLRPSAFAGLTTIVGLLSLLTCDVGLVRDFGRVGAQAVAGCFAVTFVPALLLARLLAPRGAPPEAHALHAADTMDLWPGRLAPLVDGLARHRWLALGAVVACVLAALPALPRVRTDLRAIEFLSPESPSRQTLAAVDAHMGGMNLYELQIDCGRPGGIQDPESLRFLERLETFAAGLPGVTNVYGYAQVYALLNELWKRAAPGSRTVPQSPAMIAAMGLIVHGQEFLFEESMYDAERRRTTLFIRTRDMPARRYLDILEAIVAFAQEERPEFVTVDGKSGLHSVLASDRRIVGSQVRSLALCLAAVFATLCLLWRSARLALVAIAVNLPPLAAVAALHGYGGVALNSVTVMVGAMVLGIAVDNGIHVLSFWRDERERFDDSRTCLQWVLAHKLAPMAATTAVLVSGFSLFLFSSFPPLADFGKLSILALAVAFVSTTLLAPPLLLLAFGDARRATPDPGR